MVATPQVGFAQEVMASAPPPYSEYAPPPQVTGINSTRITKNELKEAFQASTFFSFPQ